ncbi:MAG: hypothetical protein IJ053_04040, partial [Lachnospiraceae bacterium]|nr:hypothetical protein [Lachnospiraceae bacterium]
LTSNDYAEGSVVMFRDSYGNASMPYIADEFGRGFFSKGQPVDLDQAVYQNADTVIYEIVERNIGWIIEYLPYMDAPIRVFDEAVQYVEDADTSINIEDKGNRFLIYGKVDERYTDDTSYIYLGITLSDGSRMVYEASPASYESVDSVNEAYYSYGAYINKAFLSGDFDVEIITEKNDKWYGYVSK